MLVLSCFDSRVLFDSGGQIQCISGLETVRAMLFERALRACVAFELILPSLFTVWTSNKRCVDEWCYFCRNFYATLCIKELVHLISTCKIPSEEIGRDNQVLV